MTDLQDLIRQRDALNVQIEEMQKALQAEALSEIQGPHARISDQCGRSGIHRQVGSA